jgi:hypothetical protein
MAILASLRLRDPLLLASWLDARLAPMSTFMHRRFFRALGIQLRLGLSAPAPFGLRGVYMYVVGKISVSGNAMSRAYLVRAGLASNANLQVRQSRHFTIVRTHTGCLGLTVCFYF